MSVIDEIAAERQRQIEVEGWTAEHDDKHDDGEMAIAAACYADHATRKACAYQFLPPPPDWPWADGWWKPKDPRRDLVRAAALIVAEIERLDREADGNPRVKIEDDGSDYLDPVQERAAARNAR